MRHGWLLVAAGTLLLALGCDHGGDDVPRIETVSPCFASTWGGDEITVRGVGLGGPFDVTVSGRDAQVLEYVSDREFRMAVPPGLEGPAGITVTLRDGSWGECDGAFRYQDPTLAPSLTIVSPGTGLHEGGVLLTLSGSNFHPGIQVFLGNAPCTVVQVSGGNLLTALTPETDLGCFDVLVENPDGRMAWMAQAYTAECLTAYEQFVLDLVNLERAAAGLGALTPHPALCKAARKHCQDMVDRDFYDHQNPDGLWVDERVTAEGYVYDAVGENIAAGLSTPYEVMGSWMGSPDHRMNILDPDYQEIGIGRKTGGSWGVYWTQVFARPRQD